MIGFDSYYASISLLQLSLCGIKGIGTINVKRKGLGKKFVELKKKLQKTKDLEGKKKGGYNQGYYRFRGLEDDPNIKVVIQKDNKVMLYADNFLSSTATKVLTRFNKVNQAFEQMKF